MLGLLADLVTLILKKQGFTTHIPGNIFLIAQFLLISYYYKDRIFRNRILFHVLVWGLSVLYVFDTLNNYHELNTLACTYFLLVFILYSIAGFFIILKEQRLLFIEQSSFFWVNVAFLVYATGSFFIFLFKNELLATDKQMLYTLWVFHNVLNILKNVFLGMALAKDIRT